MTTRVPGEASRMAGRASSPSMSGIEASSTMTAGPVGGGEGDGLGTGGALADDGEPPAQPELRPHDGPHVLGVVDHDDVIGFGLHGPQRYPEHPGADSACEFGPSRALVPSGDG